MQNAAGQTGLNERINGFVQKNRTPIFVSLGVVVLAIAGFIVSVSVISALRARAVSDMEALLERYETLRPTIAEESSAADAQTLLTDLETFAKKTGGYAGAKAFAAIAAVHAEKKAWAETESAWTSAAAKAKKTYLEPLAWFNAAAAAEEQNKNDKALEYYAASLASKAAFPAAAIAQFSIGRLKESGGDSAGAIETYRALITDRPRDTVWVNLAHSRITALEIQAQ